MKSTLDPSCPICGGPIRGVRSNRRTCVYRCVLCFRRFLGPFQNDMTDAKWRVAVEGAAKKAFANEITARKFMATPPEDEPRVEKVSIAPGGTFDFGGGGVQILNSSGKGGENTEIVFAGPITAAEEKRLNDAGIYPDAMTFVANCDDCGERITGKSHFGPMTLEGIEEWCDACDKKPKRNKRRRA